ncbi:MAG: beta/gamma crystallin-related protein, partial [Pseudomonadota bacterium]
LALMVAGFFAAPAAADHKRGFGPGGGAEIILYSEKGFRGEARAYYGDIDTLSRDGFNDVARSVEIRGGAWTLCKDRGGRGRCRTIDYSIADLGDIGLDCKLTSFYQTGVSNSGYNPARGDVYRGGGYGGASYPATLFTRDGFDGRAVGVNGPTNLRDIGFNDKADSILIDQGRWIVCTKRNLRGRCEVLGRSIRNLDRLDLGEKISSIAPYRGGRRY